MGLLDYINPISAKGIKEEVERQKRLEAGTEPTIRGALKDPQFLASLSNNAKVMAGMQTATGLPDEQTLAKMDWPSLIDLRKKFTGQDQQNVLAPYEHRAYAREFTDGPIDALKMALFSTGYTPYKAATGEGRSQPSLRAIGQGLLGTWEGMTKANR
jgi:hypothetical protein